MSNVEIKPLSAPPPLKLYANAQVSASTWTRELSCANITSSCSKVSTSVIELPSAAMSNVEIKPSLPSLVYANAQVSASTWTIEFPEPLSVSCSRLLPRLCVLTAVTTPVFEIVNVEIKPSKPSPLYANAQVSASTWTRELSAANTVSCSRLLPRLCVVTAVTTPVFEIVNVEIQPSLLSPEYANAQVSASTWTRELSSANTVSCSRLLPRLCVVTAVIVPSAAMSNVEIKPSLPPPEYANAQVSASTWTRELY